MRKLIIGAYYIESLHRTKKLKKLEHYLKGLDTDINNSITKAKKINKTNKTELSKQEIREKVTQMGLNGWWHDGCS